MVASINVCWQDGAFGISFSVNPCGYLICYFMNLTSYHSFLIDCLRHRFVLKLHFTLRHLQFKGGAVFLTRFNDVKVEICQTVKIMPSPSRCGRFETILPLNGYANISTVMLMHFSLYSEESRLGLEQRRDLLVASSSGVTASSGG